MIKTYNEDQQVELIKSWWSRYGNAVLTVIVFVVLAMIGNQFWHKQTTRRAASASILYDAMTEAVRDQHVDAARQHADELTQNFKRTVYASYANLLLAKLEIEKKNYAQAEAHFQWVKTYSPSLVLKELANVRLVRLLIYQKKYQDALELIERNRFKVFMPLVDELKGDAKLALGQTKAAQDAYQKALTESTIPRPMLRMKMARMVHSEVQISSQVSVS